MIETEELLLRPITSKDNVQFFSYRSDAETNKYQNFVPQKLAEVDAFIAKNPTEFNQPNTWFQLVIIKRESDKIIGDIGIHFIKGGLQCEIGCTLAKQYQGKGYAFRAMKICIDFLFCTLDKHRITASVDPKNSKSIQLLERLKFRKEAHFKEALLIKGEWVDDVIYGLLKEEWVA
ncbi:GNAT family N-acetyltransferase [Mesonia aquimarina]|uniref:GNAT family N-acetyltransferase n=1 Tax=Mesonia aquimarina TaxID=1504967 RepID=UPI000EF57AE1|nr:GNAT family protein [Mesonia aquimarina]